jgi:hypothetical protein
MKRKISTLFARFLRGTRNVLAADLDHADPLEEAKQILQQKPYGLGFVRARNRER